GIPEGPGLPAGSAPQADAGLRVLRARRAQRFRHAAIARRAGLGSVASAHALDRATGEERLKQQRLESSEHLRRRESAPKADASNQDALPAPRATARLP